MNSIIGPWVSVEAANRRDARVEAEIRRQGSECPICKGRIVVEGHRDRLGIKYEAFCVNAPSCEWSGVVSY